MTRLRGAGPIGRANETALLERAVNEVANGSKRCVLIQGDAGMGKTTLLFWTHRHAEGSDFRCGIARSSPPGALQPRFPLPELLTQLGVAGLSRNRASTSELTPEEKILEGYPSDLPGIVAALNGKGRSCPLGIFLDDLQWSPREGMDLLLSGLRLIDTPLLFVATIRTGLGSTTSRSLAPDFVSEIATDFIQLPGLGLDSVEQLATSTLQGPLLPSLSRELLDRTLGNPLYVTEMLRAWVAAGDIALHPGGFWGFARAGIRPDSRSLIEVITARLRDLNEDATRAASTLALLNRDATPSELALILQTTIQRIGQTLEGLEETGVASRKEDGRYRLNHPLFQASFLDALSQTRQATMHEHILSALRTSKDVSATEIAFHATRSLNKPEAFATLLEAAAKEAEQVGNYTEAANWYALLIEEVKEPSRRNAALAGRAAAIEHFDSDLAVKAYEDALDSVDDGSAQEDLLLGRARTLRMAGRPLEALADLDLAESLASGTRKIEIRDTKAVIHAATGNTQLAEAQFARLADETRGTPFHAKAIGRLAMLAYLKGKLRAASDLFLVAESECDDPSQRRYIRTNLSWFLLLLGEWPRVEQLLGETIDSARQANDLLLLAPLMTTASVLASEKGQLEKGLDYGAQALRMTTDTYLMDRIAALGAMGTALLEQGNPIEAARVLSQVPELVASSTEKYEVHQAILGLAESHLMLGDTEEASRLAAVVRGYIRYNKNYLIALDRLDAQILLAQGDHSGALDKLAHWSNRHSELPYEQARINEVFAQTLLARNQRREGLESLRKARDSYLSLGAQLRSEKTTALLGQSLPKTLGRPRRRNDADLTSRESEILSLVSEGYDDREIARALFISHGTVKKHLDNIRSKLHVQRRSQLVTFALKHQSTR